jgi:hypothetical protein
MALTTETLAEDLQAVPAAKAIDLHKTYGTGSS